MEHTDQLEMFKQYADERLREHIAELNAQNREGHPDEDLLRKAYHNHLKLFSSEMDDKLEEIADDESLDFSELQDVKQEYLSRFHAASL